jgi:ParB family transcriptional regulator, chromosome partitioning protein
MIDAGLSATKVAKFSVSRDVVKAASTAGASTTTMEALNSGQLSLVEAAAITEFIVMRTHTGRPPTGRTRV